MTTDKFLELFYAGVCGCRPRKQEYLTITRGTLEYLMENEISEKEIFESFKEYPAGSLYMDPEKLPESLWEGSLTKKDSFYYHRNLRFTSKPATVNIDGERKQEPYYLEMRIRYPMDALLRYFYSVCHIDDALQNPKRDAGSFRFLLERYEKLDYIEALDFVLALIDQTVEGIYPITAVLKLSDNEAEVNQRLKALTAEARKDRANRIVWRGYARCR